MQSIERLFVSTILFLAASACGGGTPETQDPSDVSDGQGAGGYLATGADPRALLGEPCIAVLRVNVAQLRQSPYWAEVTGWLQRGAPLGGDIERKILDGLGRTESFWMSIVETEHGSTDLGAIVIQGDYRQGEVFELMRQIVARTGERGFEEVEVRGHPALRKRDVALIEIDPRTYVLGPTERLERALAPGGGEPVALFSSPAFRELADRIGFDRRAGAFVAVPNEQSRGRLGSDLEIPRSAREDFRAAAVAGDAQSGVTIDMVLRMSAPEAAEAVRAELRGEMDEVMREPMARAMGVAGLLESISLTTEGNDTVGRLSIPDSQTRDLLGRFGNFVVLALQAEASERPSPPGPIVE